MGAAAVGATIYFGSEEVDRQIVEVAKAFDRGPRAGHGHGAVVLSAQQGVQEGQGLPRLGRSHRPGQSPGRDDPGRHHQAEAAREQRRLQGVKSAAKATARYRQADVHASSTTDNPIDLCRYQVVNCYMGRAGLINSGGASGEHDLVDAVTHRGHQQAGRRHGPDQRPQGVPTPDERRHRAAEQDSGRLSG